MSPIILTSTMTVVKMPRVQSSPSSLAFASGSTILRKSTEQVVKNIAVDILKVVNENPTSNCYKEFKIDDKTVKLHIYVEGKNEKTEMQSEKDYEWPPRGISNHKTGC